MLNDLKDWAINKGDQTKQLADGVVNEVQTKGVMDWSGTVWLVIAGIALFVVIGALNSKS